MLKVADLPSLSVVIEPIQFDAENIVIIPKNQPIIQLGRNGRPKLLQKRKLENGDELNSPKRRKIEKENSSLLTNSPLTEEVINERKRKRELAKLLKEEKALIDEEEKLKRNIEKLEKKKLREAEKEKKEQERLLKEQERLREKQKKEQEKLERQKQKDIEKQKRDEEKQKKELEKQKRLEGKKDEGSPKKPKIIRPTETKEEKELRKEQERKEKAERKEKEIKEKKEKAEKEKTETPEKKKEEKNKSPKKPAKPVQKNTIFRYLSSPNTTASSPKFVKKEKESENDVEMTNQTSDPAQSTSISESNNVNTSTNLDSSLETIPSDSEMIVENNNTDKNSQADLSQHRVVDYKSALFKWQSKVIYASFFKKGYQKIEKSSFEKFFLPENQNKISDEEISGSWKNFITKCKDKRKEFVKKGSPLPQLPHLSCIKLISHHDNLRPTFRGTFSKKSRVINGKKPLALDTTIVHYDVDSDEEWEEGSGEDISDCSGDEEEEEVEEEGGTSFIDGFVVPDGYLSDDEGIKEEIDPFADTTAATANSIPTLTVNFNSQAIQIGVMYNPPSVDRLNQFSKLLEYPVCPLSFENIPSSTEASPTKVKSQKSTNSLLKPIPVELIPEFITLINGNNQHIDAIIQTFIEKHPMISKRQLRLKMKDLAAKRVKGVWTVEGHDLPANNNTNINNNNNNNNNIVFVNNNNIPTRITPVAITPSSPASTLVTIIPAMTPAITPVITSVITPVVSSPNKNLNSPSKNSNSPSKRITPQFKQYSPRKENQKEEKMEIEKKEKLRSIFV